MAPPLELKLRVRLADPDDPPMPRPRRALVLPVGLASWLASVAVAWGVHAGSIPVASWLEPSPDAPRTTRRPRPVARTAPAPIPPPVARTAEPLAPPEPVPVVDELEPEPAPAPLESPAVAAPQSPPEVGASEPLAERAPAPAVPRSPEPPPAPRGVERAVPPAPAGSSSVGKSCEAAAAEYADEIAIGGPRGPADLGAGDYASVLNRGTWFAHCGVPANVTLDVCVAVQSGRARGVTIGTSPRSPAAERCVGRAASGLAFPAHPRLDVVRTRFSAD